MLRAKIFLQPASIALMFPWEDLLFGLCLPGVFLCVLLDNVVWLAPERRVRMLAGWPAPVVMTQAMPFQIAASPLRVAMAATLVFRGQAPALAISLWSWQSHPAVRCTDGCGGGACSSLLPGLRRQQRLPCRSLAHNTNRVHACVRM